MAAISRLKNPSTHVARNGHTEFQHTLTHTRAVRFALSWFLHHLAGPKLATGANGASPSAPHNALHTECDIYLLPRRFGALEMNTLCVFVFTTSTPTQETTHNAQCTEQFRSSRSKRWKIVTVCESVCVCVCVAFAATTRERETMARTSICRMRRLRFIRSNCSR